MIAVQIQISNHIPKCKFSGFERSDELEYPALLSLCQHVPVSKIGQQPLLFGIGIGIAIGICNCDSTLSKNRCRFQQRCRSRKNHDAPPPFHVPSGAAQARGDRLGKRVVGIMVSAKTIFLRHAGPPLPCRLNRASEEMHLFGQLQRQSNPRSSRLT